mgnify:CR=1 FL=1
MYEFKEEYVTGIESVDAEHRRLFEIADEAYVLSKEEFLVDKYDQVCHILREIKDYALQHFEHEEAYMASINYEGLETQKKTHEMFVDKLNEINLDDLDDNQQQYLIELVDFLLMWLVNHILKMDKKIFD